MKLIYGISSRILFLRDNGTLLKEFKSNTKHEALNFHKELAMLSNSGYHLLPMKFLAFSCVQLSQTNMILIFSLYFQSFAALIVISVKNALFKNKMSKKHMVLTLTYVFAYMQAIINI